MAQVMPSDSTPMRANHLVAAANGPGENQIIT